MVKPPAAVEVVLEAVMALLTGKSMQFSDTKRLLSGGEAFLVMLREFKLEDVTDARLRLVEPYCDNPVFRPENVLGVSYSASKFCAWVLGVVQAARWQRGLGHRKTNFYETNEEAPAAGGNSISSLETISEGRGMAMSRSVDSLGASAVGMRATLGSSLEEAPLAPSTIPPTSRSCKNSRGRKRRLCVGAVVVMRTKWVAALLRGPRRREKGLNQKGCGRDLCLLKASGHRR